MQEIVIASGVRTAIGSLGGSLAEVHPRRLGATVIAEALRRASLGPDAVDETILGCVLAAGMGMNVARQAARDAGIPHRAPAMTINRVCGSGLQAVISAAQTIQCGDAEVVVAGGVENMSLAPYLVPRARFGYRYGDGVLVDSMQRDGLTCSLIEALMGVTAENVAARCGIGRQEQEAFALRSQERAAAAIASGAFEPEIIGVPVRKGGNSVTFNVDEHPRPGTSLEKIAGLQPAFKADGTVTAATSSGINDGAAAVVVTTAERARALGVTPLGIIRTWAVAGVAPEVMGLGPVPAVRAALARGGWTIDDIDLVEANEAFAAQSIAVGRELGFDWEKTNVHGGAIALGHPIGASGARILVTLLHAMRAREVQRGLATLCIGGGQGIAIVVERP